MGIRLCAYWVSQLRLAKLFNKERKKENDLKNTVQYTTLGHMMFAC